MSTFGVARWNAMKEAIFKQYEEGAKAFKNSEEYLWTGEEVIIALRYIDRD